MRPYHTIRKGTGFCCEFDDGPYRKWVKRCARIHRKRDRQGLKQELKKEIKDVRS